MILMLNCSYKKKTSNSLYFLEKLKDELTACSDVECKMLNIRDVFIDSMEDFAEELKTAKALVLGVPLYVDGLPAQVVKLMEDLLANNKGEFPNVSVYVVSNLGFYESTQIKHLLNMVENWCLRMDMPYGGGIAIGAGPMIRTLENMSLKKGLNKDIGCGLEKLAKCIFRGETMENYYCKTGIPRVVYLKAAHMSFDKTLKVNGVKK